MDFHNLKRKQLQALCKKHRIPANLSNLEMANRLTEFHKEVENPAKQAVVEEQEENVRGIESKDVVLSTKSKKVRFSPEHELIEFTREPVMKRRTRRNSVYHRESDCSVETVENGETESEIGGRRGRATQTGESKLIEAELKQKKRATKAVKRNDGRKVASAVRVDSDEEKTAMGSDQIIMKGNRKVLQEISMNKQIAGELRTVEPQLPLRRSKRGAKMVAESEMLTDVRNHENDEVKGSRKTSKSLESDVSEVHAETSRIDVNQGGKEPIQKMEPRRSNRRKTMTSLPQSDIVSEVCKDDKVVMQPMRAIKRSRRNASNTDVTVENLDAEKRISELPLVEKEDGAAQKNTRSRRNASKCEPLDKIGEVSNIHPENKVMTQVSDHVSGDDSIKSNYDPKSGIQSSKGSNSKKVFSAPATRQSVDERKQPHGLGESDMVDASSHHGSSRIEESLILDVQLSTSKDSESANNLCSENIISGVELTSVTETNTKKEDASIADIADSSCMDLINGEDLANSDTDAASKSAELEVEGGKLLLEVDAVETIVQNITDVDNHDPEAQVFSPTEGSDCGTKINDQVLEEGLDVEKEGSSGAHSSAQCFLHGDQTDNMTDIKAAEAKAVEHVQPCLREDNSKDTSQTSKKEAVFESCNISSAELTFKTETHTNEEAPSIADNADNSCMNLINGEDLVNSETDVACKRAGLEVEKGTYRLEVDIEESIEQNMVDVDKNDPEVQVYSPILDSGCITKINDQVLAKGLDVGEEDPAEPRSSAPSFFNAEIKVAESEVSGYLQQTSGKDGVFESCETRHHGDNVAEENEIFFNNGRASDLAEAEGDGCLKDHSYPSDNFSEFNVPDLSYVERDTRVISPDRGNISDGCSVMHIGEHCYQAVDPIAICSNNTDVNLKRGCEVDQMTQKEDKCINEGINSEVSEICESESSKGHTSKCDEDGGFGLDKIFNEEGRYEITPQEKEKKLFSGDHSDTDFTEQVMSHSFPSTEPTTTCNTGDHEANLSGEETHEADESECMKINNSSNSQETSSSTPLSVSKTQADIKAAEDKAEEHIQPCLRDDNSKDTSQTSEKEAVFESCNISSAELTFITETHTNKEAPSIADNADSSCMNLINGEDLVNSETDAACKRAELEVEKGTYRLEVEESIEQNMADVDKNGPEAQVYSPIVDSGCITKINDQVHAKGLDVGEEDPAEPRSSALSFFNAEIKVAESEVSGCLQQTSGKDEVFESCETRHHGDNVAEENEIFFNNGKASELAEAEDDGCLKDHSYPSDNFSEFNVPDLSNVERDTRVVSPDRGNMPDGCSVMHIGEHCYQAVDSIAICSNSTDVNLKRGYEDDQMTQKEDLCINEGINLAVSEICESESSKGHKSKCDEDEEYGLDKIFNEEGSYEITPQEKELFSGDHGDHSDTDFTVEVMSHSFPSTAPTTMCNTGDHEENLSAVETHEADESECMKIDNSSNSQDPSVSKTQAEQQERLSTKSNALANTDERQGAWSNASELAGNGVCLLKSPEGKISHVAEGLCADEDDYGIDKEASAEASHSVSDFKSCFSSTIVTESIDDVKLQDLVEIEVQHENLLARQTESDAGEEATQATSRQSWTETELQKLFGTANEDAPSGLGTYLLLSPKTSPVRDELMQSTDTDDLDRAKISVENEIDAEEKSSQDISDESHANREVTIQSLSDCDNQFEEASNNTALAEQVSSIINPKDEDTSTKTFDVEKSVFNLSGDNDKKDSTAEMPQYSIQELRFEENAEDFKNDTRATSNLPASGMNEILKESDVADTIKEYIESESSLSVIFENSSAGHSSDMLASSDNVPPVDCFDAESKVDSENAANSPEHCDFFDEGATVKMESQKKIEFKDDHSSSSQDMHSTMMKNARTIMILGTPGKLQTMADMKENEPYRKRSNAGDITAARPAKRRRALQNIQGK